MSCSAERASSRWPRVAERAVGARRCAGEHRSDSLSAAFCNLDRDAREDLTQRYEGLMRHYGMTPTRNNPASPMRRLHRELAWPSQAGAGGRSCCCAAPATSTISTPTAASSMRSWAGATPTIASESRWSDHARLRCPSGGRPITRRRSSSSPRAAASSLRRVFYTAPSRLIGHRLRVHLYDDRLECFLGSTSMLTLAAWPAASERQGRPRRRLSSRDPRAAQEADGAQPIWSIAISCSRVPPMPEPSRRCSPGQRETSALQGDGRLLALAHDRGCEAELARRSTPNSMRAGCPTWRYCATASGPAGIHAGDRGRARATHRLRRTRGGPPAEGQPPTWRRGMKTTNPVDAARVELCSPNCACRRQADVGQARRAIRQGRLAGSSLPGGARRARNGRPWPPPHRASSRRSASARRQDPR